jgi:hypothetical protein
MFLWHGSGAENWHSILRTGLKNCTGTPWQSCGAAYGSVIYLASSSSISLQYVRARENRYKNSKRKNLSFIAICEVIKLPPGDLSVTVTRRSGAPVVVKRRLNAFKEGIFTLTMEEACVVRFLLSGLERSYDLVAEGLEGAPTLSQVISFLMSSAR